MIGRRELITGGIGALATARIVARDRVQPISGGASGPNPLVQKSGYYAKFLSDEGWVQTGPTVSIDSGRFGRGTNTLRMTSTNGVHARADCPLGPPPTKLLQLDVYVENPAAIARFEVVFTDNTFAGYISKTGLNPQFTAGWNRLQFSIEDCLVAGVGMTSADWTNTTIVRFALFSQPGATADIWVARFKWLQTRAAVTFTWDDGRAGCYTNAMPILKQQGWASTIYVVTQLVGQPVYYLQGGGTVPDPIALDQLHEMQDAGWDIGSHTVTHPDLSIATAAQQQYELETAKEWLVSNGFGSGARFFATPYGKRNADTQRIAAALYENLRDGSSSPDAGYETPLNRNWDINTRYQLRFQEINSLDRTPLSEFQSWVDSAISAGTWLIVIGHNVDGPNGWLTPGLFQKYVDYVASRRSQIDVMTMSEYWDRRNQSLAEFSQTTGLPERF